MATPLLNFSDFVKSVPPVFVSGAKHVVNEAVKRNYLLSKFLRGRDMQELMQGGQSIKEQLMFDEASTAIEYQPNATVSFTNPQVLTNLEYHWRFILDHKAWSDEEVELRIPDGLSIEGTRSVFKDINQKLDQRLWTSTLNHFENLLFRSPHGEAAQMETSTGAKVNSIPAFITEDTVNYHAGGSTGPSHDSTPGTGTWTTIGGVDPATESRWRNNVRRYDYSDPADNSGNNKGLFDAFDLMYEDCKFTSPGTKDQYFEDDTLFRMFIACSEAGRALYKKTCREANDRFAGSGNNDPAVINPMYNGIPLMAVSTLGTATLYFDNNAGAWVSESDSTLAASGTAWSASADQDWPLGPRFYWINANYMKMVFHSRRVMKELEVMTPTDQPTSHRMPINTYCNLICTSRQRQGIVAPGA